MNEAPVSGKTAIILIGGGMKSVHGAGFLHALAINLNITTPDIMLGSSGDAGNALYFCAGQYEQLRRIWCELLPTSEFISPWRFWRFMNVDYLIDVVFKKQEPLDTSKLKDSRTRWLIPMSDFDTGKTRYASATDDLDPFEVLRAAKAIPFLFGKKIPVAQHRYIDGELGATLQDHVDYVSSLGARNILIINHTRSWTLKNSIPLRLYSRLSPQGMRDAIIRDISTDVRIFKAPGVHAVFVSPSDLPCGTATRNPAKLRATFDRGRADALALEGELRTLFGV